MKLPRLSAVAALGLAALVGSVCRPVPAEARPNYLQDFQMMYPEVKDAMTMKCGVCHIGPPAGKKWNSYGEATGKALGAKHVKKSDEVKAALKKVETEKHPTAGKTFGDLLKEGRLPGESK